MNSVYDPDIEMSHVCFDLKDKLIYREVTDAGINIVESLVSLVRCIYVDMNKVNLDTIKPWITTRVNQLLGVDDDVVYSRVCLQPPLELAVPRPKGHADQRDWLTRNARIFMQELWGLLASAQENIGGIPAVFLEQKKKIIRQKKVGLSPFVEQFNKWLFNSTGILLLVQMLQLEQERIAVSPQRHTDTKRDIGTTAKGVRGEGGTEEREGILRTTVGS